MNTLVGEYFIYNNLSSYSLAGNPEEAFRKSCMTSIMSSITRLNTNERSSFNNEKNNKKIDKIG